MKVALVCPYAWNRYGGVQTHVRSLAQTLRARDHDVLVVAPRAGRAAEPEDGVAFVGRAVPVPANGSVAPISFGPRAAVEVQRRLRSFAPDVVHLHEPLIPSLSLLALTADVAPSVGTFHAARPSSLGYRVATPALDRAAARLAVRTVVSDAAKALVSRYFPGTYRLTPNGIDAAAYASAEPLPGNDRKRVLFFGRIERRKGLELLLQAMTRLRDLDVELLVVGDGPAAAAARKLAPRLEVDATFMGRVDDADKARVFRSNCVYCAPALGGESFGIVLLEAMAAGTPVVCSDLSGFCEVATGIAEFFPTGDAGALADALRRVLTDEEKAIAMSRDGVRRAQMFDWRRLAGGIEAIYAEAGAGR